MRQTLSARAGLVRAQSVFVHAAILAAHASSERVASFRAGEVRFFFLLFTNWIERDVTAPGQDIDLTQVRRALKRVVDAGWGRRVAPGPAGGARSPAYALSAAGLVGLAESLAEGHASFEESLFVCTFASCYRRAIVARVRSADAARRIETLLAPGRLLAIARRRAERVASDLDDRVATSLALVREARRSRAAGADDAEVVGQLETRGSYQLQRVRPLREVLLALPEDLRRFELDEGMAYRARLLFEPMARRARAECAILEELAAQLKNTPTSLVTRAPEDPR